MSEAEEMELLPFVGVGPFHFGVQSSLPSTFGEWTREDSPGADRCSYGKSDIVAFWRPDGRVEMIGVYFPLSVVIRGVQVLGMRTSSFISEMWRVGLRVQKQEEDWLRSEDWSFAVRSRDGLIEQITAYSSEYVKKCERLGLK
jgi:hypothetical protein